MAYPVCSLRPRINGGIDTETEAITPSRAIQWVIAGLFGAICVSTAHADIYTWTDSSGRVNISNLAPPDGARVTSVLRERPKPPVPAPAVAAAPQADIEFLAARVRQLELEAELARRQTAAPTIIYAPPAPQPVQYPVYGPDPAPAPSYSYGYGSGYGCDPSYFGCGAGIGWPYYYPTSVIVVRSPAFHRHGFDRGGRPMHPIALPAPIRGFGPGRPGSPHSPGGGHRR